MLPVKLYDHLVVLDRKQARTVTIKEIKINENVANPYDFTNKDFLQDYTLKVEKKADDYSSLTNKEAPGFNLKSFAGKNYSLNALKGKVVLLDFWEVWCGPCITSMPKIDSLYAKYKKQGLEVLGVMNDVSQIEPARLLMKKKKYSFATLQGNEDLQKAYQVNSWPMYVLIDKTGKITHVQGGFSDELEEKIKQALKL